MCVEREREKRREKVESGGGISKCAVQWLGGAAFLGPCSQRPFSSSSFPSPSPPMDFFFGVYSLWLEPAGFAVGSLGFSA